MPPCWRWLLTVCFSFPLYAKGVEKYRYDYAVFLLNKNIELVSRHADTVIQGEPDRRVFFSVDGRRRDQARGYATYVAQLEDALVDPRGTG